MSNLTPVQLSNGKVACYYGMIVGLVLATYTSFVNKSYGIGIFLFFLCIFQAITLIGEYKQLHILKEMEISLANQVSIEEFNKQLDEAESKIIPPSKDGGF